MAVKVHVVGRPTARVTRMVFLAQYYANVLIVKKFRTITSFMKITCKTHHTKTTYIDSYKM